MTKKDFETVLQRLVQSCINNALTHHAYNGKVMPEDIFQHYITKRDISIPALKKELLDAFADSKRSDSVIKTLEKIALGESDHPQKEAAITLVNQGIWK